MSKLIDVNSVIYKKSERRKILDDGKECFGIADHEKRTVLVQSGLEKNFAAKTLLHEIIECVNFQYQIGLRHHQIELLEISLYDTIKRNGLWVMFK